MKAKDVWGACTGKTQKEDQGKLMFSNNDQQIHRNYENLRSRGRGQNGRDKGWGQFNNQNHVSHTEVKNSKKNPSKVIC